MIKTVAADGIAAWFESENNDVLSIENGCITVQGCERGELFVARDGRLDRIDVDLRESSLQRITI
jgi:hypothetical protein